MTLIPGFAAEDGSRSAKEALHYPIGLASPLWLAYAGVAGAGVAYWWMTRWTQPANLEAALGESSVSAPAALAAPELPAVAEDAAEVMVSAAGDAVEDVAATVEAAPEIIEPVVEAMEAATQDAITETAALADDLTRLVGIGPKLAVRLAELGVTSFKDIAAWTEADIGRFDKTLDLKGRAVRDAWVAQARRFSEA